MEIKIPKKFMLLGTEYSVVYNEDLLESEGFVGMHRVGVGRIELMPESDDISRTVVEHTYLHEITHVILCAMAEHELNNNEKFVDVFSGMLHQIFKTAKF